MNKNLLNLKDLQPGEEAILSGYDDSTGNYRRKLLAMGLTKNVTIKLIKIAPLGDPVEIKIRGFSLSLRKEEAEVLKLRRN